jgi:hypothetical protein
MTDSCSFPAFGAVAVTLLLALYHCASQSPS